MSTGDAITSKSKYIAVWFPSILIWIIGIIIIIIMLIGSGKAINLISKTSPLIDKMHSLKDSTCAIGNNVNTSIISQNHQSFVSELNNLDYIILELENFVETDYFRSIQDKPLNENTKRLLTKIKFINDNVDDNYFFTKSDVRSQFSIAKDIYDKIILDFEKKKTNDYNHFKILRNIIISSITLILFVIGVVLLFYNKNKISNYYKLQETIAQYKHQKFYLENLIKSTPAAIAVLDSQDIIIRINEKFTSLFGYTENEAVGKKLSELIIPENLKDEGRLLSNENMLKEGKSEKETKRKHKDGKLLDVFVIGSAIIVDGKFEGIYGIYQDISHRKKYEEELLKSKEMAENADKLKSVFLAQMSHEIRTPINAMVSLASLLKDDLTDKVDDDHKLSLELINKSGNRIIRTVDLLLNLSEIQTGTYQTIIREFDLYSEILSKIVVEYKSIAKEKEIDLQIKTLSENTNIVADYYTVNQIFMQLIDNAFKYTDKGKILIKVFRNTDDHLTTEVIDTGIGIANNYMTNLFKPFSQEEMGYSRKYEGNGIGLNLVKKYCELNKAKIEVESEKNKGSLFRVIFNNSLHSK
ncbi:MAG: PAS domain S-box protein [Ignavibacteriae bacterium]|nr:PAS domain S-box protein [Ignavibacteriota bacterium]MCB9210402.1 PAS domain-containing sensor histidine kinase [Ignavibacteriales bacterium]MCB9219207.1 PAS domain-containing sensor histidine kinase [Ignavibacteriales bacterium]